MRRTASVVTSIVAFSLIASVALASGANYKDKFSNTGYSGSNGSLDWSEDPWQEVTDDGSYETGKVQSIASGDCPEGNNCLVIYGQSLNLEGVGASRSADLGDFESATLGYKLNFDVDDLVTAAFLHVEGRSDGVWGPLRTPYVIDNGSLQGSVSLSGLYLQDDFAFRFVVNGLLAGDVYIDHVEISGVVSDTTTTTSTTTSTTSSTTTTTLPITTTLPTITTTTLPGLLTTTTSSTTTTTAGATTTTEADATTTSTTGDGSSDDRSASSSDDVTTTTSGSPASTTPGSSQGPQDGNPPRDSGLREASLGLQASFDGGRFGEVDTAGLDVMSVAIEPNYTMAAEVIESSWVYLLVLILLIATAIVSGLDRRRLKRAKHTDV